MTVRVDVRIRKELDGIAAAWNATDLTS